MCLVRLRLRLRLRLRARVGDVRVELVVPALATLLAGARRQLRGDHCPRPRAVLAHKRHDLRVLVGRPDAAFVGRLWLRVFHWCRVWRRVVHCAASVALPVASTSVEMALW